MPDKKTIIVTGAAGFIGFHVCRKLLEAGHTVIGIDSLNGYYPVSLKMARLAALEECDGDWQSVRSDITNWYNNELFIDVKPDVVVHLAAQAGVRHSIHDPETYVQSNLVGFAAVLDSCVHNGVDRLIYASSSSVYGAGQTPLSETDDTDHPISFYGATKKANEVMAHSYSQVHGLETVGLRFFSVYGEWGRPDSAIWIFTEKIMNGEVIELYNRGIMGRGFTHVHDVVHSVVNAVERNSGYFCNSTVGPAPIFNLGNSVEVGMFYFLRLLEDELKTGTQVVLSEMQNGDTTSSSANSSEAARWLDFEGRVQLARGVKSFCHWYLSHPEITEAVHEWRMNTPPAAGSGAPIQAKKPIRRRMSSRPHPRTSG